MKTNILECNIQKLINIKRTPDPTWKGHYIYKAYWKHDGAIVHISNVPALTFKKQDLIDGIVMNWDNIISSSVDYSDTKLDLIDFDNPF